MFHLGALLCASFYGFKALVSTFSSLRYIAHFINERKDAMQIWHAKENSPVLSTPHASPAQRKRKLSGFSKSKNHKVMKSQLLSALCAFIWMDFCG